MKKICFLLFLLFLLAACRFAFASSRQEAIEDTLTAIENRLSPDAVPQTDSPRQEAAHQALVETEITSAFADAGQAGSANTRDEGSFSSVSSYGIPEEMFREREDATKKLPPTREEAIQEAFYITAAFDMNNMHYSEWEAEEKLDEDFGNQQGFYIALGYESPHYWEGWKGRPFVEAYFRRYDDLIRYKGALSGGGGPFDCEDRSEVQQYGLKIGGITRFSDKGEFKGYADIGKRIWYRGETEVVRGVQNYAEKYYWIYGGLGAGFNYEASPRLKIGLDAEMLYAFKDHRKMDADDIGYGDLTFKLGNTYGTEIRAPLKYYLLKNLSFDLTPYFIYWHIKHSDYIPIGGGWALVEPESHTHIEGLLSGLTYHF